MLFYHCLNIVFIVILSLIMCLHPNTTYHSVAVDSDLYNNCIYVTKHDVVIMQVNVRSVLSKQSKIKHLIDHSIEGGEPNVILLCEHELRHALLPNLRFETDTFENISFKIDL